MSENRRRYARERLTSPRSGPPEAEGPLSVQRDGPLSGSSPSLIQPRDPAARYRLGQDLHLQLDPDLLALAQRYVDEQLDPAKLRPALRNVNLDAIAGGAADPHANRLTGPPTPARAPIVPRGEGPDSARAAEVSDLTDAILAVPAIDQGVSTLKSQTYQRLSHDWAGLGTGGKAAVVSTAVLIGGGTLAGIASNRDSRQWALSQLNGRVLPVPGVDWLHVEVNTAGNGVMVGMHVDVGALLPSSLGFGPRSPEAIGGPPIPGQRSVDDGTSGSVPASARDHGGPSTAERISDRSRPGTPLPRPVRELLEPELGGDLSRVRVHTGGDADELARLLDAKAFTSGADIFFRSGTFRPETLSGIRLIAHEAVHTAQQSAGPVSGVLASGRVAVSQPGDPFEVAARRAEDQVASRVGHHLGRIRIRPE